MVKKEIEKKSETDQPVKRKRGRPKGCTQSPNVGRKRTSLTKKSKSMLKALEDDHKFNPVQEFVNLYRKEQKVYEELLTKIQSPTKRTKLSQQEHTLFKHLSADLKASLTTIFRHTYPTLRAMDVAGAMGEVPIFNINIGGSTPSKKGKSTVIDVTSQKPAPIPQKSISQD